MSAPPKLTKKQKKGLAFRERKGKSTATSTPSSKQLTSKNHVSDLDLNAYPAMEDQDLIGLDGGEGEVRGDEDKKQGEEGKNKERNEEERKEGRKVSKGKRKAATEDVHVPVAVLKDGGRKRKREEAEGVEEKDEAEAGRKKASTKAKRKKVDGESADEEDREDNSKQRFILFVGNLKYTTTKEAITKHFAACDPPPSIRLLTPKARPGVPATPKHKSKGCAFLEFTHRNALQQALKLHQSNLEGRMINVELTAGGGGKSESRIAKVRERNKALLGQRVQKAEQEQNGEPTSFPDQPQKPQRFSMTSGLEQMPTSKKTWTVGDIDDGETHRGGERHRGKKKPKANSKAWGTGVNAIPVG